MRRASLGSVQLKKVDAQGLQRLVAISLVIGGHRLNKPADFREIRGDRNKTETGEQVVFVHGDVQLN